MSTSISRDVGPTSCEVGEMVRRLLISERVHEPVSAAGQVGDYWSVPLGLFGCFDVRGLRYRKVGKSVTPSGRAVAISVRHAEGQGRPRCCALGQ